jgi:hypothetical protein
VARKHRHNWQPKLGGLPRFDGHAQTVVHGSIAGRFDSIAHMSVPFFSVPRSAVRVALCMVLFPGFVAAGVAAVPTEMPKMRPASSQAMNSGPSERLVEVWVDLTVPGLATLPRNDTQARAALRDRITRQQDSVMQSLIELGAIELARVQQVRNALAVRLPADAVDRARNIAGVRAIRPVTHLQRDGFK